MIQIVSSVDFASPFTAPWKLVSFWSHVFKSFSLCICQKYVAAPKQLQEYPFTTSPPVLQQDACFFNKTYPLKQMNICPRPWNSGALFERKILFQPTRHFSRRNPPAWWSGGTPRQSRVVWCLVVWGPGGFGIQSGYLLYVLLIFIHFMRGSLRNPNHWAPNHQ